MRRLSFALLVACAIGVSVSVSAPALSQDYGVSLGSSPATVGWRGLYGGAHLGGAWGSTTAYDTSGINSLSDYWSAAPSGVVAGLQLGYNWQNGPVLYGVEGDLGYLGLAGSAASTYVPFGYDASTKTDSGFYMTLRGRVGVIMNQWVFYATGGYIGTDTTVSILEACDAVTCGTQENISGSNSSFRSGWTLGGGIEGELSPSWTAKVEYLYYDLGSRTVTTHGTGGPNNWTIDTDGSLVRAGLNYRFGAPF
jgi:outer membrane immunogenic protein